MTDAELHGLADALLDVAVSHCDHINIDTDKAIDGMVVILRAVFDAERRGKLASFDKERCRVLEWLLRRWLADTMLDPPEESQECGCDAMQVCDGSCCLQLARYLIYGKSNDVAGSAAAIRGRGRT